MTPIRWLVAALKRLRDERLAALGLAALVLVTGFVFGVAPRALDATGDRVLRDEVRNASVRDRHVQFVEEGRFPVPNDEQAEPLENVELRGEQLTQALPQAVQALFASGGWQVESGRHLILDRPDPFFLKFRLQEGVEERIRYVAGRPPTAEVGQLDGVLVDGVEVGTLPVLEIALARPTAEAFQVDLDETIVMTGDQSDALIGPSRDPQVRAVRLVGTYEVLDPRDEYWLGDPLMNGPVLRVRGTNEDLIDGAAVIAPEQYGPLLDITGDWHPPLRYTWRRFVDPARLDTASVEALLVEFRRARTIYTSANPTPAIQTGFRTSVDAIVERTQAQWTSAVAILTVVAVGPAVVAAAALALVALLAAHRRRAALTVSRSRGASLGQLVAAVVVEAALLTIPAVAVAALVAVSVVPGGAPATTIGAATGVALLTTAILVATSVPSASATADASRGGAREAGLFRPPTARRLVMETLVVALALGGAWLLRERGVRGTSTSGTLEAADPLIAAVPALVGLGAGILAVRLFPLPMRLFAWLAGARRDLVPVLAMRRATSGSGVAPVLVVLLATATIGAFSSAALVHIERGAETVAWQEIGGHYRIRPSAGPLPGTLDAMQLPGAEAAAEIYQAAFVVGLSGPRVEFVVIDPQTYLDVVRGTPADPSLPPELLGAGGSPIPALVSTSLGERADGVAPGEEFDVSVEGYTLRYRAVAVRDSFPGIPPGSHFAVVSRAHFNALAPPARLDPTHVLVRAADDRAAELRAAALEIVEGGTVESRAERTAAARHSPVVVAVRLGIAAAAVLAAVYAALAVAAALALAGVSRAVEVAHLRTLGLTRRQAFGLVAVEHGPTIVAAFAAGVALGIGLFLLLRPGLGLSALIGSAIDVPLAVEAGQLALVLAAIVAIVILGLAIGAALQRAAAPVAAIRRGFE
jgi:putative ABC transport system permease protein